MRFILFFVVLEYWPGLDTAEQHRHAHHLWRRRRRHGRRTAWGWSEVYDRETVVWDSPMQVQDCTWELKLYYRKLDTTWVGRKLGEGLAQEGGGEYWSLCWWVIGRVWVGVWVGELGSASWREAHSRHGWEVLWPCTRSASNQQVFPLTAFCLWTYLPSSQLLVFSYFFMYFCSIEYFWFYYNWLNFL